MATFPPLVGSHPKQGSGHRIQGIRATKMAERFRLRMYLEVQDT